MGTQNGIDMKLRLSIILPTIAVGIVLAVLVIVFPDPFRPLIFTLPALGIISGGLVFYIERKRRRGRLD